jgi:hypothetical protein
VLVLVIGIGLWFTYTKFAGNNSGSISEQSTLPITDVIPKNVVAVVVYNGASSENKDVITSLWSAQDNGSSSVLSNPSTVLTQTSIANVYYFTLPNNKVPFMVVPKNTDTTAYISGLQGVAQAERGGWYILHEGVIDDYKAAVDEGVFTSSSNASLVTASGFVARFIVDVSGISHVLPLPANLVISKEPVVFDVNSSSTDGAIHGAYTLSQTAVSEKVNPDVAQLTGLVPSDAIFLRTGEHFSDDILSFQQTNPIFDLQTFNQPAIQQFITKLTAPYAIYSRLGVDGTPDTGLIIQLPDSLRGHISHSDSAIEQLLISFAPFVTGRPLDSQIVFADGSYNAIPIRYANLQGQSAALDYTVGDNFILISSSREGMQALGQMALGAGVSAFSSGTSWESVMQKAESFVPYNMISGIITDSAMLSILPGGAGSKHADILVSTKSDNTGIHTYATVEFSR